MNGLWHSRKFWLAMWGLIQTIIGHYLSLPADIIMAADAVVAVLIASIAAEDVAQKWGRPNYPHEPQ